MDQRGWETIPRFVTLSLPLYNNPLVLYSCCTYIVRVSLWDAFFFIYLALVLSVPVLWWWYSHYKVNINHGIFLILLSNIYQAQQILKTLYRNHALQSPWSFPALPVKAFTKATSGWGNIFRYWHIDIYLHFMFNAWAMQLLQCMQYICMIWIFCRRHNYVLVILSVGTAYL